LLTTGNFPRMIDFYSVRNFIQHYEKYNNNYNNLETAITNINNSAIYTTCFHILVIILCVLTRCDCSWHILNFTIRLHSDAHSNIPMKYYGKSEVMKSLWLLYAKHCRTVKSYSEVMILYQVQQSLSVNILFPLPGHIKWWILK
jgi:hypothetical protein